MLWSKMLLVCFFLLSLVLDYIADRFAFFVCKLISDIKNIFMQSAKGHFFQ